jgi:hypothetical protein
LLLDGLGKKYNGFIKFPDLQALLSLLKEQFVILAQAWPSRKQYQEYNCRFQFFLRFNDYYLLNADRPAHRFPSL